MTPTTMTKLKQEHDWREVINALDDIGNISQRVEEAVPHASQQIHLSRYFVLFDLRRVVGDPFRHLFIYAHYSTIIAVQIRTASFHENMASVRDTYQLSHLNTNLYTQIAEARNEAGQRIASNF